MRTVHRALRLMREPSPQQRQQMDVGAPHAPLTPDDAACKALYRAMLQLRLVDERMAALFADGTIGFHASSAGAEATLLGGVFPLRASDWVFPSVREAGVVLWRGQSLDAYVSQLFGTASDATKGRQQPQHGAAREHNCVTISSPVGTQLPQATGMAMAAKMAKKDDVALAYLGMSATSTGDFHVGVNFAGVWKAPVVFLCRSDASERPQTAAPSYAEKGRGYGVPSVRVDGDDLFAVLSAVSDAVVRARRGEGPTLIEAVAHAEDPVLRWRSYLEHRGLWSQALHDEHTRGITAELDAAIEKARVAEPPAVSTIFDDVYAVPTKQLVEQRDALVASGCRG